MLEQDRFMLLYQQDIIELQTSAKMEIRPHEIEKAKEFWSRVDVDHMFDKLNGYLNNLRATIKNRTASDREYVWSMTLILESEVSLGTDGEIDSIQEVLISSDMVSASLTKEESKLPALEEGEGCEWKADRLTNDQDCKSEALVSIFQHPRPDTVLSAVQTDASDSPLYQPALQPQADHTFRPLSPVQPSYQSHACDRSCVPSLALCENYVRSENPLKVPLLYHFQRLHAKPCRQAGEPGVTRQDVLYKAPCGRSMRNPSEVLCFLHEAKSEGVLRLDNFSFNGDILVEQYCSPATTPLVFEKDISKGLEPVPVQLCNEVDGMWPEEFRYRKDRWPHGCFISSIPPFSAYCDCQDGCMDASKCSCLTLSLRAACTEDQGKSLVPELYTHRRLLRPVPSGIYECGPWCGCKRERCQNRLVQDGLRVRLQVYRTWDRGWGVRCLDDIDQGTYICTYAGVLLRAGSDSGGSSFRTAAEPLPLKRRWEETTSDDEVEVVEEWKVASEGTEASVDSLDAPSPDPTHTSSRLHVSVIQGLPDKLGAVFLNERSSQCEFSFLYFPDLEVDSLKGDESVENETRKRSKCRVKRTKRTSDTQHTTKDVDSDEETRQDATLHKDSEDTLYYVDATEEGNVGRFLNHSCCPNLFVQNVFIDSHDRNFPTVAFFTSRMVKAGTELTWNHSYAAGSSPNREVSCHCGCESCQGTVV
ncbi:histone-lysine N-methyltransferase SETDB2-like isoform X1 [Arapaima gigas]